MKDKASALLYNLSRTERGMKVKFLFVRMGVRIVNVSKAEYLQKIGALAGMDGMTKSEPEYEGEGFQEEMIVLHNFTDRQINDMLRLFREKDMPKIGLKAAVTETNSKWNSLELYEEIKREHEQMSKQ